MTVGINKPIPFGVVVAGLEVIQPGFTEVGIAVLLVLTKKWVMSYCLVLHNTF